MSGTSVKVIPAVKINQTFSTPRERLFQAWIDRNELRNWFIPTDGYSVSYAEVNPRKNTRFRLALKDEKGEQHLFGGVLQQVNIPEKLVFTWAQNAGGTQLHKSFVTVEFKDKNGQTEIQLTHDNFSDEQMMKSYSEGWKHILDQLQKYLG